jgi:uncharacterized protein YbjT (DUF2867 family)
MIVVLGAFGRTGRAVAAQVRAAGCAVRMVTRHPRRTLAEVDGAREVGAGSSAEAGARGRDATRLRASVEIAVARRFDDGELGGVMRGARALYAILPDDLAALHFHAERRAMAEAIARAIHRENVPRVVLLSSRTAALGEVDQNAQNGLGTDLAYFERLVLNTNAAVSILRASYFQDNLAALLPVAERDGIYPDFLPPGAGALITIAAADVGAFAARALLEPPRRDSELVDLLGPGYTPGEIADALARAVGRRVDAVQVPAASQVGQFQQWMSPEAAIAMAETLQCLGSTLRGAERRPGPDRPLGSAHLEPNTHRVEQGKTQLDQVLRAAVVHAALAQPTTTPTARPLLRKLPA